MPKTLAPHPQAPRARTAFDLVIEMYTQGFSAKAIADRSNLSIRRVKLMCGIVLSPDYTPHEFAVAKQKGLQ